ncbi:calmodulin-binding transcription activator 2 isoform X3 [Ambystoma mexicanum]|uniref:calmodulin-binding transcription activator 2 isoform X3 n=1 Tax=Ambystoma mexicanum TaxID=8296 RepID=UPI0037E73E10
MNNKDTAEVSENNHHIKVFLPKKLLECLPKCTLLPKERLRWNTNEEIASYLITFEKHEEWLSCSPKTRPQNGSIILYNRKKVKYRKDGYCWKKRKDGKTTREDHMKLKVQGVECLYGCYVHSSIVPTFHRRCYWLLQNPDIVLVHYLNVPAIEDCGKICGPILCSINSDRKEWLKWSKEELINQLKPMFHGIKWTCSNGNGTTEFSIEQLVQQILDSHQAKPPPRTHACLCNSGLGTTGNTPHKCSSTKHRIISPKVDFRTCPYPALTEVQNIAATDTKPDLDHRKSNGFDKKDSKLARTTSLTSGGSEVSSSSSSSSYTDNPDSTHNSPVTITNDYYGDHDHGTVTIATSVPNLTVGSVTCGIAQNTVLVMTGLGGEKPLSLGASGLTPSQHLIVADSNSQTLPLPSHNLSLSQSSSPIDLALLPAPVGMLVFSQKLEANMDTAETNVAFDPDSFLNSPRQGQTYGGGAGSMPVASSFSPIESTESSTCLEKEVKTEDEQLDSASIFVSYQNSTVLPNATIFSPTSNLVSVAQTFPVATQVTLVSSSLEPVMTLANIDRSSRESPTHFLYTQPISAHGPANSSCNQFFIQDDNSGEQLIQQSSSGALPASQHQESGTGPKLEPQSTCSDMKEETSSAVYPMSCPATTSEADTPMDTTSHVNSAADSTNSHPEDETTREEDNHSTDVTNCYAVSESQESTQCISETTELQSTNISDLYTIIQNDLSSPSVASTNMELNMDHFNISFDSQFPDLISDLMTEEVANASGYGQFGANTCTSTPAVSQSQPVSPSFTSSNATPSSYAPQLQQHHQSSGQFMDGTSGILSFAEEAHDLSVGDPSGPMLDVVQLVTITDFSPEWSYPEGGVKVLITGPWTEDAERYSCVFDQITVPASLIQSGVLRCYCPAHEAGLVTLQVVRDSQIVSSSVLFEYRARTFMALPSTQLDWLSLDDNQFRMSILERLEQMEKRMAEMTASNQHQQQQQKGGTRENPHIQASADSFEERIVAVCEKMMSRSCWRHAERLVHDISFRGMTLLHLAAAQGYSRLIRTLIQWRSVNAESLDLEQEADPLNVDHFSCTPLMWACALGHIDAAVLLYQWNRQALNIPDSLGRLPLSVARSRGHVRLATCLEEMQREEENQRDPDHLLQSKALFLEAELDDSDWQQLVRGTPEGARIASPLSSSPDTGLSTASSSSSPSELSESPVSVTSAYSSSSALRGSPDYSSETEMSQDMAMDISETSFRPQLAGSLLPSGIRHAPKQSLHSETFSGSDSRAGFLGCRYLPEDATPPKHKSQPLHRDTTGSTFFMDYEATLVGGGARGYTASHDPIEEELLGFSENAENEDYLPAVDVLQVDMITLAEQIIEATPDRIKQETFSSLDGPLKERQSNLALSKTMSWLASYLENVDQLPSLSQHRESCRAACTLARFAQLAPTEQMRSARSEATLSAPSCSLEPGVGHGARSRKISKRAAEAMKLKMVRSVYKEPLTPPSAHTCLSPIHSPLSDIAFEKFDSPSAANWSEFLNASANGKMESEFALLTLSDHEQRELYEAAKIIQTAFRKYKGRRLKEQQEMAAAVIQRCYRKYKQLTWIALKYALYKKMTQAAILIQSKFRSYYEQKKFQQSRRAAVLIQQYYRSYKEYEKLKQVHRPGTSMQQKIKGPFLTKKQDQAARKIMRFLRRCRHRMKELKQSKELESLQKRGLST